VILLTI